MSASITDDMRTRLRQLQQSTSVSPEIAELRLTMLRAEVPQALMQIDAVRADDTAIAVKVTIGLPGGARLAHIAAADVDPQSSWSDQMAMVQATAVVRVLDGLQSRSAHAAEEPAAPVVRRPAAPPVGEEDHLPEYSWNAFWQTMNQRGVSRDQVEKALGKTVQEATPREAVDALKTAGLLS